MCLSLFVATPALSSTSANVKTIESTQQQKQAIKGVVKDTHGEPVIGASVMVNGVAMAVTDVDGNFSLAAAPGAVLQVSYVGFKPQSVTVKAGMTNYTVSLQDDNQALNEVVVVGYGVQKKVNLTGSVSSVKGDAPSDRCVAESSGIGTGFDGI